MQLCASIGAESDDVAGVRGNFRLIEDDVEHDEDRGLWLMDYSMNKENHDRSYHRPVALV
jgi:hypothetical protein